MDVTKKRKATALVARRELAKDICQKYDDEHMHTPRTIQVLKEIMKSNDLIPIGTSFGSLNEGRIRIIEANEVEDRCIKLKTRHPDALAYECSIEHCSYLCSLSFCSKTETFDIRKVSRHSCRLHMIDTNKVWTNYSERDLSLVVEHLFSNNRIVSTSNVRDYIDQYTMGTPFNSCITRIKSMAFQSIYGLPRDEIKKVGAYGQVLREAGHEFKVVTKSRKEMLERLQGVAKTIQSYEAKDTDKLSYFNLLIKKRRNEQPNVTNQCKEVRSIEEIMEKLVGEESLKELKCEQCVKKYLHGLMFAPKTSIQMAKAGFMPDTWTGDGAHMFTIGIFLCLVCRDKNHNIHCVSYGVFFNTECYDSLAELFKFTHGTYGSYIINKQRIVADRDI